MKKWRCDVVDECFEYFCGLFPTCTSCASGQFLHVPMAVSALRNVQCVGQLFISMTKSPRKTEERQFTLPHGFKVAVQGQLDPLLRTHRNILEKRNCSLHGSLEAERERGRGHGQGIFTKVTPPCPASFNLFFNRSISYELITGLIKRVIALLMPPLPQHPHL